MFPFIRCRYLNLHYTQVLIIVGNRFSVFLCFFGRRRRVRAFEIANSRLATGFFHHSARLSHFWHDSRRVYRVVRGVHRAKGQDR